MAYRELKNNLHLLLLKMQRLLSEFNRWKSISQDRNKIALYYGFDHVPKPDEPAGGGIIKCQDLQRAFPNTLRGANILYLISSSLPHYADIMVKYAKRYGAKLVWNQNGVAYPGWHGPGWDRSNKEMKKLLFLADYVVYQSQFCKISADRYLGTYQGPYDILPNPVDTSLFVPATKKPPGNRLLLAGSHQQFYRVRSAIELLLYVRDQIPDITLTIAGRYIWKDNQDLALSQAKNYAEQLGLGKKVEFRGVYTQEEAVPLFQNAHILVHTKYNDPCPRLVVEAMSCGLPIVYSDSGGVPELVGSGAGEGVSSPLDWKADHPPDPKELAHNVIKVLNQYDRYSSNARKCAVNRFDVKAWIDRHRDIFRRLVLQ